MDLSSSSHCEICNISLTGEMPALQHYSGEKHKKRLLQLGAGTLEKVKNVNIDAIPECGAEFSGTRGFCHVCDKELTSRVVYEQHIAGKSHAKAHEIWRRKNSLVQKSQMVGMLSSGGLSEAVSPKLNDFKRPLSGSDVQESKKCYYFDHDKEKGGCDACGVKFTDFKELLVHLKTDDHKDEETTWESAPNKSMKKPTTKTYSQESNLKLNTDEALAITRMAEGINPADNTSWHHCKYCKKSMNTIDQLKLHEASPKHKKTVDRIKAGLGQHIAEQTIWRSCSLCGKKVNSDEQLKIHMKSHNLKNRIGELSENVNLGIAGIRLCEVKENDEDGSAHTSSVKREDVSSSNWAHGWQRGTLEEDEVKINIGKITAGFHECILSPKSQLKSEDKMLAENSELKKSWFPYCCVICDIGFTGEKPYLQHLEGKSHARKVQLQNQIDEDGFLLTSPYKYHCSICDAPFYTERDLQAHIEGKRHIEKAVKVCKAPKISSIVVRKSGSSLPESDLILYKPRDYQIKLYKQAMLNDTVCFLPTGTGKTLVAMMVLRDMLSQNPNHSAVFLVDKILLGFQQYQVIKKQIGEKYFRRYDADKKSIVERTLNIALVCSGKHITESCQPLWQHDVIVATAAYYENLLDNGTLHWDSNCLVILDEAHHCAKEHPYCRVMISHHHPTDIWKPKILGLTASPAGKSSLEKTTVMMKQLLKNLGGVKLITAETDELQQYSSNTPLIIKKISLTEAENTLRVALWQHLLKCTKNLNERTNIAKILDRWPFDGFDNLDDDLMKDFVVNIAESFQDLMCLVTPNRNEDAIQVNVLKDHTTVIAQAIFAIQEVGLQCAWYYLKKLTQESFLGKFSNVEGLEVECSRIKILMSGYDKTKPLDLDDLLEAEEFPVIKELLNNLVTEVDWNVETKPRPMVLVLARQRKDVKVLKRILANSSQLKARNIEITYIIGHGPNNSDGMSVKKQDATFQEIKDHKYQVVVATSIAEEGIDIPECEMVVQMDPPTNVNSLVQIRGRARKRNSKFLALCRDQRQVDVLESLKKQEKYMIQAAKQIMAQQFD